MESLQQRLWNGSLKIFVAILDWFHQSLTTFWPDIPNVQPLDVKLEFFESNLCPGSSCSLLPLAEQGEENGGKEGGKEGMGGRLIMKELQIASPQTVANGGGGGDGGGKGLQVLRTRALTPGVWTSKPPVGPAPRLIFPHSCGPSLQPAGAGPPLARPCLRDH